MYITCPNPSAGFPMPAGASAYTSPLSLEDLGVSVTSNAGSTYNVTCSGLLSSYPAGLSPVACVAMGSQGLVSNCSFFVNIFGARFQVQQYASANLCVCAYVRLQSAATATPRPSSTGLARSGSLVGVRSRSLCPEQRPRDVRLWRRRARLHKLPHRSGHHLLHVRRVHVLPVQRRLGAVRGGQFAVDAAARQRLISGGDATRDRLDPARVRRRERRIRARHAESHAVCKLCHAVCIRTHSSRDSCLRATHPERSAR